MPIDIAHHRLREPDLSGFSCCQLSNWPGE